MKKIDPSFALNLLNERKELISILRSTKFTQLNKEIPHRQIIPYSTYAPWECDLDFKRIYKIIKNNTLVDIYRCYEIWHLIKQTNDFPYDIIEVGVWRGGTGAILAKAAEKKSNAKIYLCDTFMGVVKAGTKDSKYKGGEHSDTSEAIVKNLLNKLEISNTIILRGIFPDESAASIKSKIFRFCHIDVDTYDSAKDIFEYIWPRICAGGLVVFDDYGFWGCEGITTYVNSLSLTDGLFVYNLNGHAIIMKIK